MKKILFILLCIIPVSIWAQDKKVSDLTATTTVDDDDLFYIIDGGTTSKNITGANLKAGIPFGVDVNILNSGLSTESFGIGESSLSNMIAGSNNNYGLGAYALQNLTSGQYAIGIGTSAGQNVTSATSPILIGHLAGALGVDTSDYSIGIGYRAMYNGNGYSNIGMGRRAGYNLDGMHNIFLGMYSGYTATNANYNFGVGFKSLYSLTSGGYNISLGPNSLGLATSGSHNVSLGSNSLGDLTTGGYNVALGTDAGDGQTTASGTVKIGFQVGSGDNTSNTLWIDNSSTATPLIYGNFATNLLTINGSITTTDSTNIGNSSTRITKAPSGNMRFTDAVTGSVTLAELAAGEVDITDIGSYAAGGLLYGGAADWEVLTAGTQNYVLKMGATYPAWGQVAFSELTSTPTTLAGYGISDVQANFNTAMSDGDFLTTGNTTLSEATIITTGDGSNYFRVQSPYTAGTSSAQLSVDVGQIELASYPTVDYTGTTWSKIRTTKTEARSQFNDAGSEKSIVVNGTDMLVTDAADSKGLYYAADYSAGETDRWIPDKGYVDGVVAAGYNSGSGITIDGSDNIDLGGALDATTVISAAGDYLFQINSTSGVGGNSRIMQWDVGEGIYLECYTDNDYTGDYGLVSIGTSSTANIILSHTQDGGSAKSIQLTNTSMLISDADDLKGMEYAADYSGNYTDRSLVDKEYVVDATTGAMSVTSLAASGVISGLSDITLDTDPTVALTAINCANKIRVNNDADVIDYTLPAAAVGLVVMFYDIAGGVITIDPVDGTDTIYLNGASVGAGDAIDSAGSAGNFIVLVALDDTRWVTMGRDGTWVDGGAD